MQCTETLVKNFFKRKKERKKEKRKNDLTVDYKISAFQMRLDIYCAQMEQIAQDVALFIDKANAPFFGINTQGNVNEWNQKSAGIIGFSVGKVRGKHLVSEFITAD